MEELSTKKAMKIEAWAKKKMARKIIRIQSLIDRLVTVGM